MGRPAFHNFKMLKTRQAMVHSYRTLFNSSLILPLFIYFLVIPNLSFAANAVLFEETFVRGKGKPETEQRNFTALAGEASLIIHNGDANGKNRASSAVIILNGTQVVGPNEFNQQVGLIEKPLVLNQNNTLEVKLRSAPGSFLSVQIGEIGEFPLTFTVSSARREYALSEPVILTLTLKLNPHFQGQMTVATFEAGTISVRSATRNGTPISSTTGSVRFIDDPVTMQIASLRTISPGDHVTIPFNIPRISNQGSDLIVKQIELLGNVTSIYPLTEPGLYRVQFLYHYTGPDDGKPNVFRDEVLSNQISFRLR
jgi:hypothetical protein